jgi:hypothetical protein
MSVSNEDFDAMIALVRQLTSLLKEFYEKYPHLVDELDMDVDLTEQQRDTFDKESAIMESLLARARS